MKRVDWVWLSLIALTLFSGWLGGYESSALHTVVVAFVIATKGRLVIDYYMELPGAHPTLRRVMSLYFILVPLLIVGSHLFGTTIARLSALYSWQ